MWGEPNNANGAYDAIALAADVTLNSDARRGGRDIKVHPFLGTAGRFGAYRSKAPFDVLTQPYS